MLPSSKPLMHISKDPGKNFHYSPMPEIPTMGMSGWGGLCPWGERRKPSPGPSVPGAPNPGSECRSNLALTPRAAGTWPAPRTHSRAGSLPPSTAAGWLPASGVHHGDGCPGAVAARGGGRRKSVTRGGQSARRRGGTTGGGKEEQQEIAFQGSRGLCPGPGELQVPLLRIWVLAADGAARDEV